MRLHINKLAVQRMEKYRNPTLVKIIIFFTFVSLIIASLSPDFMFGLFGSNDMEPFANAIYQGCIIGGNAVGWNIGTTKEAGVFAMFAFLIILLISFVFYRVIKLIYNNYKTANKAIKKDV